MYHLTVQEISQFTHTLPLEVQHARQTNLSARNRKKGTQARNHQRREKWRIHQFGLLDSGSLGTEQPRKAENAGGDGDIGLVMTLDQQATIENRALSSETARQASSAGMSDSEILESMGIDMNLKITK